MKVSNLKTGEFVIITDDQGIYKGTGIEPYFSGTLRNGQPCSDGPGNWDGYWFKLKKDAIEYLEDQK